MDVGILGTGMVGRTLGGAIAALGHDVVLGTREPATLSQRNESFGEWHAEHAAVRVDAFGAAAAHGEVVFNATAGAGSLAALALAGAAALAGKVLIDAANPLDFSSGMPALTVCNTDSLGEQIQAALPGTRVVKALNTVTANVMVDPTSLAQGAHDLFLCGDDAAAKSAVASLLRDWFGWESILDLGDITAARGMEMYLPLWIRLMSTVGSPMFSVRVVR